MIPSNEKRRTPRSSLGPGSKTGEDQEEKGGASAWTLTEKINKRQQVYPGPQSEADEQEGK